VILVALLVSSITFGARGQKMWNAILGDSNDAPLVSPQVIRSNLPYKYMMIQDVNSYGLLISLGIGVYSPHNRALVVPFNGESRELNLGNLLKGDPIEMMFDRSGFVVVETQIKFGCAYLVYVINPRAKVLSERPFDSPYGCEDDALRGIGVSLYRDGSENCFKYYEELVTGDYSFQILPESARNFCLTDKLRGIWEPRPKSFETILYPSELDFVPVRKKNRLVVSIQDPSDWRHKKLGNVSINEDNNPRLEGLTTRLESIGADNNRRLYATYVRDSKMVGESRRTVVVMYSETGVPLARYEAVVGDFLELLPEKPFAGGTVFSADGEWFFVRKTKAAEFSILKISPKARR